MKHKSIRDFTIVELLVVVSIMIILISILMPALSRARDRVKQINCSSNLRNWGQAKMFYANDYDDWQYNPNASAAAHTGWRVALYSYLGFKKTDTNSYPTLPVGSVSTCPSDTAPFCTSVAYSSYGDNDWGGFSQDIWKNIRITSIKHPSKLFSMGDNVNSSIMGILSYQIYNISFRHSNGLNMLFYDGHAEYRKTKNVIIGRDNDKELWGPGGLGAWP